MDSSREYSDKGSLLRPKNVRMAIPPPPPPPAAQYGFPKKYSEPEPHKEYREYHREDRPYRE